MSLFDLFKQKKKKVKDDGVAAKPAREDAVAQKRAAEQEIKKEKAAETQPVKTKTARGADEGGERYSHVILHPLITEKASYMTTGNAYTFSVREDAGKPEVAKAVQEIYGVTPIKVRTVNMPSKTTRVRGKKGVRARGKKAVVYLKEGDRIEFV